MQDRPSFDELLEAVQHYLREDVMPNTQGRLSFHARVAGNAIEWIRRELQYEEEHAAREWRGLDGLLGDEEQPASLAQTRERLTARNENLAARIRAGDADAEGLWRDQLLEHLRTVTRDKLAVANPRLLAGD